MHILVLLLVSEERQKHRQILSLTLFCLFSDSENVFRRSTRTSEAWTEATVLWSYLDAALITFHVNF